MKASPALSRAPSRLRHTARAVLLATASLSALAQEAQVDAKLNRVEITGSAIKRLESETALPVQVISREEIARQGLTTAAEIVARLSASANNLTDGVSISYGGFRDQMGMNGANLRGLGVSSTLVLLNGRRMANFASPGDSDGVDLNSIPAAAIQRVEVLLDGASSLYGSDAIGGVINFITRKDYQSIELDVSLGNSQEGGAGKRTLTLSAGLGDYSRDGFNIFGVLDIQGTSSLHADQRRFISDLKIPERLPDLLSGFTFPGNIRLTDYQLETLKAEGFSANGKSPISTDLINPSAATGCNPPGSLYLPKGIGGVDGCTYDYMRDVELYPKTRKSSAFGRGILNLGQGHQLFAEAALSQARSYYVGSPNRITVRDLDVSKVPAFAKSSLLTLDADDAERLVDVRTRLSEAGRRTSELLASNQRYVAGVNGSLAGWDYELAFNHSRSEVSDRDYQGYLNEAMVRAGFADGTLSPFGASSAAGLALLEKAQIRGEIRRAKGTMNAFDFKFSGSLAQLAGGDLALAVGGEWRREEMDFHQSDALKQDLILGESSQGPDSDFSHSRKVGAVFAELSAPLTRELELMAAVRFERYQVIGSATSPKLGIKYTPSKELLLRASVGSGFRAPSLNDLYRPLTQGSAATLVDPVCMIENPDKTPAQCSEGWTTYNYSNPNLKPEKSRQFSTGLVFEPNANMSFGLDYWSITKRDLISTLGVDVILAHLDKYANLVHRDEDNAIDHIDLIKQNRGQERMSGLDLTAQLSRIATPIGLMGLRFNGTYTMKSEQQMGNGDPFVSNLGRFLNDGVVQRWRHTLSVDWERGNWGATLANSYLSSYLDQHAVDKPDRRVSSYTMWDLSGRWEPTKALTLRAGVKNLFNETPPYSQQAYYFLNGYDPSYTDPRGRFFYVGAQYRFR